MYEGFFATLRDILKKVMPLLEIYLFEYLIVINLSLTYIEVNHNSILDFDDTVVPLLLGKMP
jgi:hypothetical protein